MPKRLTVALRNGHAMMVTRVSIGKKRLVYVILAQKPLKYRWGRSRVVYIGTTKKGMARIAQSVAARAETVLDLYGVREFHVRILTCAPRPGLDSWVKLERALLLAFREKYGDLPKCNSAGKNMREDGVFDYFKRERLGRLLEALAGIE